MMDWPLFCYGLTIDWPWLPPWLPYLLSGAAILFALICLLIVVRTAARARADARAAAETAARLTALVGSFESGLAARIQQATAPVEDRIAQGEREAAGLKAEIGSLANAIAEVQKGLNRAVQRFEHFEEYFRSVFEKELRFAFRSFDETMGGVLKEMKGELMRGITRIDQIQGVVNSRSRAEAQLTTSEVQAARLLKSGVDTAAKTETADAPPAENPPKAGGEAAAEKEKAV